jgi:putative heme transporter
VPVLLIVATFGFALPHLASYRSVWATIGAMALVQVLVLAVAAAGSLVAYWIAIRSVLPAVRLREAAVVNLSSTAVANTLPAGGAVAMGVTWAMLSSWGIGAADFVLYTVVSGIWNAFTCLSLPAVAVLVLATARQPDTALVVGAAAALGILAAAAAGFGLILRSKSLAIRADRGLQRAVALGCRLARRPVPAGDSGSLLSFRDRAAVLLRVRGWRITAATVASQLALWLVLLACLRGVGLSQAQVPWQTSLAAFAFVRLLTLLPLTPGGLGITELGLAGILAGGAGPQVAAQVIAAVLIFRALTFLLPIPLGAAAGLAWRYAPVLIRARPSRADLPGPPGDDQPGRQLWRVEAGQPPDEPPGEACLNPRGQGRAGQEA